MEGFRIEASHLAVHVLKDAELRCLVRAVKGVVAVLPVGHDAPALERRTLPRDG